MNEQLQKQFDQQFDQVFGKPDQPKQKPDDIDAERAAMRRLQASEAIGTYNQQKAR